MSDPRDDYPLDEMPAELREKIEAAAERQSWFWPYHALLNWLERRNDAANPPWGEAHYQDWNRADLVWRVRFLQGCNRAGWIEVQLWKHRIAPVLVVLSLILGVLLGRSLGV